MTTLQTDPKAQQQPPEKAEKSVSSPATPATAKPESQPEQPEKKFQRKESPKAVLRFTPTAWAKLLYFRDRGDTEIGGFGVTARDDLLLVEDFVTVRQKVTMASVSFDDEAVADFFESQVDAGRKPEQFARLWLHSHPGESPQPSAVDEETFDRVFGRCEWAVMFVIGRGGKTYARLRFNVGPKGEAVIPVELDYGRQFGPTDHEAWQEEYLSNIKADTWFSSFGDSKAGAAAKEAGNVLADDWLDAFEAMDPEDRRFVIDELASRPDLWDESEAMPW